MKKFSLLLAALALLCSFAGCGDKPDPDPTSAPQESEEVVQETEAPDEEETDDPATLDALQGCWRAEDGSEKLDIMGSRVEITGYYEMNGSMIPGVVTEGSLRVKDDGTLELRIEGQVIKGSMGEDDTLILGDLRYYSN